MSFILVLAHIWNSWPCSSSSQGDKNIIKFDGDHNSSRPQFYYDSVSIFFYNVLHPPQIPSAHSIKAEKYYDLGALKFGASMDQVTSTSSRHPHILHNLHACSSGLVQFFVFLSVVHSFLPFSVGPVQI